MLVATSPICQPFGTTRQSVNLFAKMADSFAHREVRIQTPIIGLIEFKFSAQNAAFRNVLRNRANNWLHKHLKLFID